MLKEENKSKNEDKKLKAQVLIYGSILLIGLFFSLVLGAKNRVNQNDEPTKRPELNEQKIEINDLKKLFVDIEDNYTMNVTRTENDDTKKLNIQTDGKLTMYEGTMLEKDGYLTYKDIVYYPENGTLNKEEIDLNTTLNLSYNDISIIKNLLNYCEPTSKNENVAECNIDITNYLKEYNYVNNTTYKVEKDETFQMIITYQEDKLVNINVDYTTIDKIINESSYDKLVYDIKIYSIGKNNFEEHAKMIDNGLVE